MTQFSLDGVEAFDGADPVVIWAASDGSTVRLVGGHESVEAALGGGLLAALQVLEATGRAGEITRLPTLGATKAPLILVAGVGPIDGTTPAEQVDGLRRGAGAAARAAAGRDVVVTVPLGRGEVRDLVSAIVVGWRLGAYRFDRYRSAENETTTQRVRLVIDAGDSEGLGDVITRAETISHEVMRCRDLVNMPASDLTPAAFAAIAADAARALDLEIEILDDAALKTGGYGGLTGVGQGSANPPRLVRITHPAQAGRPTMHLVGKGITFDSGGLSLKQDGMASMKGDMAGAAVVLCTVLAAARLGVVNGVVGWLALAENMPSGSAMRPSDVITIYGGTTVEVLDTDAEGRLVMADALVRAVAESPDALIDVATLTGAQGVVVGTDYAAVLGNDDRLRDLLLDAARECAEPMWPFPLVASLRSTLDSRIADIRNIGDGQRGKLTVSALFLSHFVPDGIPWAHLDIAGPGSNHGEAAGHLPSGATGATVRTLVHAVEAFDR